MYTPKGELNDELLKIMQQEETARKLMESQSREEAYEVLKAAGCQMSLEEIEKNTEIMKAYFEEKESGVLSDDDLDQVAGGKASSLEDVEKGFDDVSKFLDKYSPIKLLLPFA